MITDFAFLRSRYFDSVYLMRVAKRISGANGILAAAAVMATGKNLAALAQAGFADAAALGASPNDVIVAVRAESGEHAREVLDRIEEWLAREPAAATGVTFTSVDEAARGQPGSNLAVISVPGEYAAGEARRALEAGLNVFLFSDNVPLADEIALKRLAGERGLLMMGPDCGTAIIGGAGIGFANAVRRGPVGVIGASGTGTQEITTLVHRAGSGISHAIGTGSHDLSDAVGGATTLAALDALEADPLTHVVAVVSKPPGAATLARLRERLTRCSKPVVTCFLGADPSYATGGPVLDARDLSEAARQAVRLAGGLAPAAEASAGMETRLATERQRLGPGQRYVRGVFAGGTLCYQAQQVLREAGFAPRSNAPLEKALVLADPHRSAGHTCVDLGDDVFTRGRPHPMIDATLRCERIRAEGADPATAVLLVDVVLGFGSASDPAGDIAGAIRDARRSAEQQGGYLPVVASVCGTAEDHQGLAGQTAKLEEAGALVLPSAVEAARAAVALIRARA